MGALAVRRAERQQHEHDDERRTRRARAALVGLAGLALLLAAALWWAIGQNEPAPEPVIETRVTTVTQLPTPQPSSLQIERDDTTIRVAGMVKTESEREAIVAAATNAGFEVDDAIEVAPDVTDSDPRVIAVLLTPLLDGTDDGRLSLDDGSVTITGEALDPVEAEEIQAAIDDATAAGLTVDDQTTIRVLPESVQIAALQEEIDQIFELARTIEGQYPNFDVSVDQLSEGAITTLDRVAVAMRRYPLPAADVIGHTDSVGSDAHNQALSEARAAVVTEYLLGTGIEPGRLQAIGRGEAEPVADNASDEGRAENRRVDFLVKKRES